MVIAPPLQTSVVVRAFPEEPRLRVIPLADRMTVGRLGYGYEGEPIQLFDPTSSSGRHCRLLRTAAGALVEDLGSTNTTRLNGELALKSQLLQVGDLIQAGTSLLRFEHTLAGEPPWPADAQPLLEAVLGSPADDSPRRVLADWLAERGDPRGEFISCQLATNDAASARAAKLLTLHELAWLRPLPVPVESWTFARGFLATVRVSDVEAAQVLRSFHPLAAIEPIGWE